MGRPAWSYNFGVLIIVICPCHTIILDPVYWNTSNSKFTPGQGLVLYPQIGDKLDIVCPRVRGAGPARGGGAEYHRVYLVTRSQLERCGVDQSDAPLLSCDKPERDVKFTFKFQEFSPNLWGLEFLRGRDYYITSTSTGTLRGLDNTDGGLCRTKSMRLTLRVGQSASDPPTAPRESPTRYPPRPPKSGDKGRPAKDNDVAGNKDTSEEDGATETTEKNGGGQSKAGLLVGGVASGGLAIFAAVAVLLALLRRRRRRLLHRRRAPEGQRSASMPLDTLAGSHGDDVDDDHNDDSDPGGDAAFPLRHSESAFYRHYERVAVGNYGPPVYIVQEVPPPQSPTDIYYKV